MWPPEVERVAAFLRTAGVEGRLEEIPADEAEAPGPAIRARTYECDGRAVVVLIPADREVDQEKLSTAAQCAVARRVETPAFPYRNAVVLVDRLIFSEHMMWIDAGSARHFAALAPAQIAVLTGAATADLVVDA